MQIQKQLSVAAMEPLAVDRLRYSELCSTPSAITSNRLKLASCRGRKVRDTTKGSKMGDWIFTFGYEGLPLEAFIGRLKVTGVQAVLDVRANPLSRKPDFSKTAFSTACMESKSFTPIFQPWDARSQYGIAISGTATGLLTPAASLPILKARRTHSLSLRAPRDARHHALFASRPTLTAAIAPTSPELPPNLLASESYISRIEQRSLT